MKEETYKKWDLFIKIFGFLATALSISIGVIQFNRQQRAAIELELNKNFWQAQNQVYTSICNNAGNMIADIDDSLSFAKDKKDFISAYYGQMILVEDNTVDSLMRNIKPLAEHLNRQDIQMVSVFRHKIALLAEACKNSSETFTKSLSAKAKK
ncbi:MAG TPA: hypothetical protein VJ844_12220 [Mucilaginibacter sp.]|nr:hypothetical protein [Mucilaginibacter sp.]